MMKTKLKQEDRFFFYQLFWHYYRGDLMKLPLANWQMLAEVIQNHPAIYQYEWGKKALTILEELNEQMLQTFEFDYNRLFVGPNKLLAPPYESSYRNYEGAIMQQETLQVRNFYYYEGLQVANEGQLPDDHLQFELEFICYLLSASNYEEKLDVLDLFLEKHLLKWGDEHCERIEEHSQNPITLAFGYLFKGFLQLEKMNIEGGD